MCVPFVHHDRIGVSAAGLCCDAVERKEGVRGPQPLQAIPMMLQHHGTCYIPICEPSWRHVGPRPDTSMIVDHLLHEDARHL